MQQRAVGTTHIAGGVPLFNWPDYKVMMPQVQAPQSALAIPQPAVTIPPVGVLTVTGYDTTTQQAPQLVAAQPAGASSQNQLPGITDNDTMTTQQAGEPADEQFPNENTPTDMPIITNMIAGLNLNASRGFARDIPRLIVATAAGMTARFRRVLAIRPRKGNRAVAEPAGPKQS